jgi:CRISPR-associated protein Csb1
MSQDVTMLVGHRTLQDPVVIGVPGALSHVAVPTYAPPEGEDRDNSRPSYVAQQVLDVPGGRRQAVIVDSVQSEANRVEERLAQIFTERPELPYPRISIPFPDGTTLTNWHLAHRSADQILRLTDYFDNPSRRLKAGPAFLSPYADLTYFVERFPIDVILGMWQSHKGPTVKLPRLLSATMIGYTPLVPYEIDPNNRMVGGVQKRDPLVTGQAKVLKRSCGPDAPFPEEITGFDFTEKGDKRTKLSSSGFGDIANGVKPGSIFAFETVEQRVSLALSPLRNARFPHSDGRRDPARDAAGRAVLVALGRVAFRAALEIDGMLRSGCLLSPVPGTTRVTAVDRVGADNTVDLPSMDALLEEYTSAIEAAKGQGFNFEEVTATPKQPLVDLYLNRGKSINRTDDAEDVA